MPTLQAYPKSVTHAFEIPKPSLDVLLHRLSSSITRATSETANAFFCAMTTDTAKLPKPLKAPIEMGSLTCSQKNIGDKYEMICNLEVGKTDWNLFFNSGESDRFTQDTFCEMANCICGTLLSDPGFSDEFGYMIPCVPWSLRAQPQPDASTLRGAFKLSGILVYFSISVQHASCVLNQTDPLKVAA